MRVVILMSVALLLVGCTSYEKISSGAIGCAPSRITVYDVDTSSEGTSWTAVCQNAIYYCFQADSGMGGKMQCSPARNNNPPAKTVAAVERQHPQAPYPQRDYKRKDNENSFLGTVIGLVILDRLFGLFGN